MAALASTLSCSPPKLLRASTFNSISKNPLAKSVSIVNFRNLISPIVVSAFRKKRIVTSALLDEDSSHSSCKKLVDSVFVFCASVALSASLFVADVDSASAFVVTTPRKLQSDEVATVRLFQENTPSVVNITNFAARQDAFTLDLLEVPQGSGSGFVWDMQGHVVTNYHVIRGASDLKVTLADQSIYDAKVVGFDQDKDVALLRIDAPKDKLRPIPIGVSADLLVGQKVYAIGNPFGLDHTLTTGVISGLRREISSAATGRPIQDVIQTDAAINPGNSGGPLLDSSGNLIGINTAIYSPSGASSGVGFSIPVDTGHVVTNYHVIRGASDLKVTLADQSIYDAKVVGFDQDKEVALLRIDAPKDKLRPIPIGVSADLLVGQKVYAIGNPFGLDHTLTTGVISGLRREISSAATGRPIQDVIQTDAAINPGNSGGPLLDSSGNLIGINTAIYSPSGASSGVGFSIPVDTVGGIVDQLIRFGKVTRPILGIKFAPDQSLEQLGVSGVLVLDAPPDGPAGKAGLRPSKRDAYGRLILGDIITSINGKKVANGGDLYRILDQCKVGDKVTVEVLRGDHLEKIPVTLEPKPDET
ncbi:Serine protease [Handroanthus impetiginosus]|uniref:Serine protease n=1 Tax=Handroanthus impetiginosus TaxID=429701 RepID=A0A2G9GUW3_9LAMI|nr:Serine protease [Handroanthus impetiginosus]